MYYYLELICQKVSQYFIGQLEEHCSNLDLIVLSLLGEDGILNIDIDIDIDRDAMGLGDDDYTS